MKKAFIIMTGCAAITLSVGIPGVFAKSSTATSSAVMTNTMDKLQDQVKDPLQDQLQDPLQDQVKDQLQDPLQDQVKDQLQDPVQDMIHVTELNISGTAVMDGSGNLDPKQACKDADGDGFFAEENCGTPKDCNDTNSLIFPGAKENCIDGIDNDCDQMVDMGDRDAVGCPDCTDMDQDGYSPDGGNCGPKDCADHDPAVNPGAVEACGDGMDNNCSGADAKCGTM